MSAFHSRVAVKGTPSKAFNVAFVAFAQRSPLKPFENRLDQNAPTAPGREGPGGGAPLYRERKNMFWLGSPAIVSKFPEMCVRDTSVIPNVWNHKLNRLIYIMFFIFTRLINCQFPGYRY